MAAMVRKERVERIRRRRDEEKVEVRWTDVNDSMKFEECLAGGFEKAAASCCPESPTSVMFTSVEVQDGSVGSNDVGREGEGELRSGFVECRLDIHRVLESGWRVVVAGSGPKLGEWNPFEAMEMWLDGVHWVTKLALDGRTTEYKYAFVRGNKVVWEAGSNRLISYDANSLEIEHFRYK